MKIIKIKAKITEDQQNGKRIFTTSSFQSHSLVLPHITKRNHTEYTNIFY